jgi:tetratricopeptide (TPR) repeat protein
VVCAARVNQAFLVLLEGGAAQVRELAGTIRRQMKSLDLNLAEAQAWPGGLRVGAATVDAQSWEGGAVAVEAAAAFKARAQRALACAGRVGQDEVLFFSEIVDKAGRLAEILPLNRVRVNLGRLHGLGEGERFQVMGGEQDEGGRGAPKAEVVVVSVGEEESVAEVVSLDDPTWNLRPGDPLRRLGHEAVAQAEAGLELVVSLGGREIKVVLDEVTGLVCHRSFMSLFSALCAGKEPAPFAAVLVRLEGLEGIREVCGRVGADSLMAALAAVGREVFPEPELLGRFAPDTLAALLPGAEAAAARDLAAEVLARLSRKLERGLRAGVAFHPCPGFGPSDALDNAAKALVHAGFLEPGAVVIFDAVSLNISGDTLFNQGRLSEAVAEYERALLLSPVEPNVLNSLGVCYGHLGQTDKAMAHFERALAATSQDFMAHYNLGYALMGQGRLAEARQRLEESLALAPDHADTLFQLGRLAQGEGRLDQALDLLSRASLRPDCRRAVFRHLGEVRAASGRFAEAEEAFKQAAKANPHDAAALASLAGLYLERGANLDIALSLARRAGELEPQAPRHLRLAAQALTALGRLEEAVETLRQALAAHPQDPFLAVQMGKLEAARGQSAAARDEFRRALALEPNLQAAKEGLAALDSQ